MKHYLFYQDNKSNKFWNIELIGNGYKTTNGRMSTSGRETFKEFPTEEQAKKKIESLVKSKLKKGYTEGEAPKYLSPEWGKLPMNSDCFWRIINLLNWKKTGDDDAVIKSSVNALRQMLVENIFEFQNILSKKLYDLDAKKYAVELGEYKYVDGEYFSADNFLYERCVIVANGKEYYEKVLNNPQTFQKESLEFEVLLSIAREAYELKTGEEWNYYNKEFSYETGSNKKGWNN